MNTRNRSTYICKQKRVEPRKELIKGRISGNGKSCIAYSVADVDIRPAFFGDFRFAVFHRGKDIRFSLKLTNFFN